MVAGNSALALATAYIDRGSTGNLQAFHKKAAVRSTQGSPQTEAPRHEPTAMWIASIAIFRPRVPTGGAVSQAPDSFWQDV